MSTRTVAKVGVRWRWSFLLLVVVATSFGYLVGDFAIGMFEPPHPGGPVGYAGVFTGLLLVALVAHESGHALVGTLIGHRLERITFAAIPSVTLTGDPVEWRRVVISLAGPAAEAAAGWVMLRAAPWTPEGVLTSPAAVAGLLALANAALSVVLPIQRNGDGRKVWRGVRQTVQRVLTAGSSR